MVENEIVDLGGGIWATKKEIENLEKIYNQNLEKRFNYLLFNTREEEPTESNHKKWAKIVVEGEEMLAFVDNQTMIAYETDGNYGQTDIVIPDYTFVRWARGMDL